MRWASVRSAAAHAQPAQGSGDAPRSATSPPGKTLTTITLLWTALRQGPTGAPLTRRAVVVTPSSLVDNWAREFKKWLGNERLRPLVMNVRGQEASSLINDFEHGSHAVSPVLIVSYEMYRKFAPAIHRARPGIMVCDEVRPSAAGARHSLLTRPEPGPPAEEQHGEQDDFGAGRVPHTPPHPAHGHAGAERPGGVLRHALLRQPLHPGNTAVFPQRVRGPHRTRPRQRRLARRV